ncbi:glycoside hydrolase family protein [Bradyrhizobium australafricanum]|uniref:glycoside hydrolase family protein n=1 Tax=Bradyrhizobium australafricanum TaxID=2821406 RepID=UPI001CE25334|nr:glycoside hydrolase family protein [Bradyrhizobium australafricanum]MCA6098882.1 glycoside hydrolase family protein [Bradyrhizobium australafricanum]
MSARKTAITVASAAAIAMVLPAVKKSEGYWPTVKVDTIGTGRPCTGGYGETEDVKCGETHTEAYWSARLEKRMREYDARIGACIHVEVPDSVRAAMLTTSYNAGTGAVCKSPMVARINAGDFRGACAALLTKDRNGNYNGWYIRAQGRIVRGLINRRRDDQKMCFSGVDQKPKASNDAAIKAAADALPAKVKEDFKAAPPEGPPCYGRYVDDRTYTSHPECRAPQPVAPAQAPAPAKPAWHKWIFK